jgi:hypothetical protein
VIENEINDPEKSLTTETTPESTLSLTSSEFSDDAGFDPVVSKKSRRRISAGTMVIMAVIGIAIGGLVSMRTFARVTAADTGTMAVESTIDDWLNNYKDFSGTEFTDPFADSDAIEVLTASYSNQQVPLTDVSKNPFILPGETAPVTKSVDPRKYALEQRERDIAAKTTLFETTGNAMRLKSIMLGAEPLANIDGQIVQIGDAIEVDDGSSVISFTVTALNAQTATLVATEPQLDLSVEVTLQLNID